MIYVGCAFIYDFFLLIESWGSDDQGGADKSNPYCSPAEF
jgi:hypothetical protein